MGLFENVNGDTWVHRVLFQLKLHSKGYLTSQDTHLFINSDLTLPLR